MFKRLLILSALGGLLLSATPVFSQTFETVDTAWVRRYNGPGNSGDKAYAIAADDSGNVYVTGFSQGSGTADDYATIKYYPNGDTAWVRRYNGPSNNNDDAEAIAIDGSGNVYVTGISYSGSGQFDYATIKYDFGGNELWVKRYNGPGNSWEQVYDIAVDASGNVYVTGWSLGSGTESDYATIKYDSSGTELWVKRYNGPGNWSDEAHAVAVDGSGNVYVTGGSYGSGTNRDYATIKYKSSDDTAWVRRYNGPGNWSDEAHAVAVDGSGNVYVTGNSYGSITDYDYTTIKYYSNGDTAWIRRYNGTGDTADYGRAIAVDGSGNVYVTGLSYGSGTGEDYCTIKYYSNGNTAWVRRYNGPGNAGDDAHAIAIDGSGNVYVTGESVGSGANYDYVTIKYDPDGYILWEKRYNGPDNGHDHSYAIALDDTENVYVTGGSIGGATNYDYATIKYIQFQQRNDTLWFFAYSPVDLIVTDPSGDSIGVDFNTIPGASYDTLTDYNGDDELDDRVTIPEPLIGEYTVRVVVEPGSGGGSYTLAVKLNGNEDTPMVSGAPAPGPGEEDTVYYPVIEYLRGDANTDGSTSISDVIFLINYLFKGGPAPVPLSIADANCCQEGDGTCTVLNVSVSDVIYLINYLFKGGNAPCS